MDTRNQTIAAHRIERVELLTFRARYPRLHGMNAIRGYHGFGGDVPIARLTTDQGATGWGVLSESVADAAAARGLVEGKRLDELFACETGILDDALKVYDIPLHDLAARILGVPVCRMINPDAVSSVPIYDGAIYMNDIIPSGRLTGIERVLDDCAADIALGHRALKIKIGRGNMWMEHDEGMRRDIEVVNRIHDAFPAATLMVDANDGYTAEDAIAFLSGVAHVPLYWFEEPMREEAASFGKLKDYIRTHCPQLKIADGESMTDIPLLFDLAAKGLLDVWQPDVCGYGFTAWRKLLKQLVPLGYIGSPHAWGYVVKTHCCAHLAAAYPQHIPYIEAVLGSSEGVDMSGYQLLDGRLSVPSAPGFGMELEYVLPLEAL